jgi:hypothetical protein
VWLTSCSRLLLPLVGAMFVPFSCARAELGGPVSGVRADSGRAGARLSSVSMGRYTRQDLVRANGGSVREFTNADGHVFAVTWSGPGKPDLRVLLGRYFGSLQTAGRTSGRWMHSLRHPVQVTNSNLKIQATGHMGWYRGVALVPSLQPRGFSTDDLQQGL